MPQPLIVRACLLPAAVLLPLSACASEAPSTAAEGSGTPRPSASASPTGTPSTAPAAPATPSPTPSASSTRKRTRAELKGALLTLKDLPGGFEIEQGGGDDGTRVSSSKKDCAPLVRLMNSQTLAGSRAQAEVSFSGGQEGPFIDESLDAMGTAQAARAFIGKYRSAVKACGSISVSFPGVGASSFAVREISFSDLGDDTFAARFRAKGGPLEGLEFIQAGVQSGDIVVGTSVLGLDGADAEAATEDAVKKVAKKLGTSGSI